jgi:hypothetical protein
MGSNLVYPSQPSVDKQFEEDSDSEKEKKNIVPAGYDLTSSGVPTPNPEALKFNKLPSTFIFYSFVFASDTLSF